MSSGKVKEEEQDGMSDLAEVELELKLLQAFEIYPPNKLQGVHRHFVILGLMEYLKRSFDRPFSSEEVLQLLDRFYNVEMLKSDDDEIDILNHEEEFSLPPSFFMAEES
ncbi:hypothetical protein Lal_00025514 [Lupinus albus]|uniref:Uncharacterized protein n=1 Tax=Lupinus albus TaxID=3870 RepID=A0A6A4PW30_LUPAL|nr:hypothetical protein Lalb_Chr10g0098731 [Lupinus albus]KAF1890181.1 hypothetical protein Lal_00025514 [Lupinus albus]